MRTNLVGQRFGLLTVVNSEPFRKGTKSRWFCQCDCGGATITNVTNLRKGHTKSCGCYNKGILRGNKFAQTHGYSGSSTYRSWFSMKQRCRDMLRHNAKYYVAKGITVCDRWLHSFENFLEDMGGRPEGRTLDRIDNDLGYFPDNCRWATPKEQANNRTNHKIETADPT